MILNKLFDKNGHSLFDVSHSNSTHQINHISTSDNYKEKDSNKQDNEFEYEDSIHKEMVGDYPNIELIEIPSDDYIPPSEQPILSGKKAFTIYQDDWDFNEITIEIEEIPSGLNLTQLTNLVRRETFDFLQYFTFKFQPLESTENSQNFILNILKVIQLNLHLQPITQNLFLHLMNPLHFYNFAKLSSIVKELDIRNFSDFLFWWIKTI
ncbi:hypothetical protein HZS_5080 [Henneguya salminicola]|nr:hypothetical protein HZS_5080 [Henneguya salminicola]